MTDDYLDEATPRQQTWKWELSIFLSILGLLLFLVMRDDPYLAEEHEAMAQVDGERSDDVPEDVSEGPKRFLGTWNMKGEPAPMGMPINMNQLTIAAGQGKNAPAKTLKLQPDIRATLALAVQVTDADGKSSYGGIYDTNEGSYITFNVGTKKAALLIRRDGRKLHLGFSKSIMEMLGKMLDKEDLEKMKMEYELASS